MKFFRQTKETKRKISFFMALAMVISLLPVSPVAKAEEKVDFGVVCSVDGVEVSDISASASGSAVITLVPTDNTKKFNSANGIKVAISTGSSVTIPENASKASIAATGSGVATTASSIQASESNCTITITGITAKTLVTISGDADLVAKDGAATATPTGAPTATPTGAPTATPTGAPTATPVPEYKVSVTNEVGENIALTVGTETIPATGEDLSVAKGTELEVAVAPNGDYIWKDIPELRVDNAKKEFTADGAKYTSSVTIEKDTTIAVSGGSVMEIPEEVVNTVTGSVDADASAEASDVADSSINLADANIAADVISAIASKNENVSAGAVVEALKDTTNSSIKTIYTINASTNAAIDTFKNGYDNIKELGISETDYTKAIDDGFAVDIEINVTYTLKIGETEYKDTVAITVLKNSVAITMPIPEKLADKKDAKGKFYAFRLHDGKVDAIECTVTPEGKLTFESDKFSTYVISFVEDKDTTSSPSPSPTTTPGGSTSVGGGIGGYIPSTSATPAPSATAAPSESPSADPSAAPGTDNTAAPSESDAPATGGDATPTDAPAATDKPADSDDGNTNGGTSTTTVKVGKKATVSGSQYKVTAVKGTRTVQFTKGKTNAKSIVVPSTVKISGKNYKVTTIAKNAFKGNKKLTKVTIGKNVNKIGATAFKNCTKLKSVVIKTTKLTAKKVGKNAFKGIKKNATFKVPSSKVKAYTKIVKAKGAGKNVKVKK